MKQILLLTDFSQNAWNAMVYAVQLFKNETCNFTLVNSFDSSMPHSTSGILSARMNESVYNSLKQQSEDGLLATLSRLGKEERNPLHTFETLSVHGVFFEVVSGLVTGQNKDYIVVGAKGETGLREVTIGSSASSLIAKVVCPILVIPENANYTGIKEITLSTDYEVTYSEQGLQPFIALCQDSKTQVSVVYVNEQGNALDPEKQMSQSHLEHLLIHQNPNFFTLTDVSIALGVRIFVESRKTDILCLIAKKHNFLSRFFGSSHTKSITHQSKIPLLILHNDLM